MTPGATCWTFNGKGTRFVGSFQKGQVIRARANGEAFYDEGRRTRRTWEPWTLTAIGPKGFVESSENDALTITLPSSGRYSFNVGPCSIWGNRGRIEICADPVRTDSERERVASSSQPKPKPATDQITLVSAAGRCQRFAIGSVELSCDRLAYFHVEKTGRTTFNIPHESGALGLSGGSDIQPTAENYVLSIDSVLNGRGSGQSHRSKATGTCTAKVSRGGEYLNLVECKVQSEFGLIELRFLGGDKPVTIKHLSSSGETSEASLRDDGSSCPPFLPTPGLEQDGYRYLVSAEQYAASENVNDAVKRTYGSSASIAEWNDLKRLLKDRSSAINLATSVGLPRQTSDHSCGNVFVTVGGAEKVGEYRYLMARHEGSLPKDWLAVDQIGGGYLNLGRWTYRSHALVRVAATTGKEESPVTFRSVAGRWHMTETGPEECRKPKGDSDAIIHVTEAGYVGYENRCTFLQTTSTGPGSWRVKARCSGEGETGVETFQLVLRSALLEMRHGKEEPLRYRRCAL